MKTGISHQSFESYITEDSEVIRVREALYSGNLCMVPSCITGAPGSGITHLMSAIFQELTRLNTPGNVRFVSAHFLDHYWGSGKKRFSPCSFPEFIKTAKTLLVDDVQALFENQAGADLLDVLHQHFGKEQKKLIIGCSDQAFEQFSPQRFSVKGLTRLQLPLLSSRSIHLILQEACRYDRHVPRQLLRLLASYSAPVKKHLHCLIRIRFMSRAQHINLFQLDEPQLNHVFGVESWFNQVDPASIH